MKVIADYGEVSDDEAREIVLRNSTMLLFGLIAWDVQRIAEDTVRLREIDPLELV